MNLKIKIEVDIPGSMPQPDVSRWIQLILQAVNSQGFEVHSRIKLEGPDGKLIEEYSRP